MTIQFNCPNCDALIAFDGKHRGKRARCITCGQRLIIPLTDGAVPTKVKPDLKLEKTVEQQTKETTSDPRMIKHLYELTETANILAHHACRMLRYKNNDDIETSGNITMVLRFWRKSTGQPITENIDPLAEFRYVKQHRVDSYTLKCLFAHYEDRFGKLPFVDWEEVTMENVYQALLENLLLLTSWMF